MEKQLPDTCFCVTFFEKHYPEEITVNSPEALRKKLQIMLNLRQ